MSYNQAEMEDREEAQQDKYLTFTVDADGYGIDIRSVTEIIGMQPVKTLPEVPAFIKGVINLRGKIIPVADMRLRLGKDEAPYTDRTCVIVVDTESLLIGLIVDQVAEVMVIAGDNIVPPPALQRTKGRRYISGIGKTGSEMIMLIDCEKLFDSSELSGL